MGGISCSNVKVGCVTPLSSWWDLAQFVPNEPSAEALGYSLSSLRDLGHGENFDGTSGLFAPGWQPGAALGLAAQATARSAEGCGMACQAIGGVAC